MRRQKSSTVMTEIKLSRFHKMFSSLVQFVNGRRVVEHTVGHLPFEAELNKVLDDLSAPNVLTVAVNNTLTLDTIPQGDLELKVRSSSLYLTYIGTFVSFIYFSPI